MAAKKRRTHAPRLQIVPSFYVALTILDRLLYGYGPLTPGGLARELADEMAGTVPRVTRSIRRYITRFEALGFRFTSPAGGRGIHVAPAFRQKLHLLAFTEDELTALYFHLALAGGMLHGTELHTQLATVSQKIGLGVRALYNLATLGQVFLPFQKWYKTYTTHALQTKLGLVLHALQGTRVCQFRYRTPHATRDWRCTIHPYALFAYEGGLYLYAYLPDDARIVVLSLERIRYITVLEVSFEKAPEILAQIAHKRERAFGVSDDETDIAVVLRFTADQAPYVRERVWHPSQEVEERGDGSLLLRFRASGEFEIVRWILGWGEAVEVLEPPELRQTVVHHLQEAAQHYAC